MSAELQRLRSICLTYETRTGIRTHDLSGLVRSGTIGLSCDSLRWLLAAHTRCRLEEMIEVLPHEVLPHRVLPHKEFHGTE